MRLRPSNPPKNTPILLENVAPRRPAEGLVGRRAPRLPTLVAVSASLALAFAYGCGDSNDGAGTNAPTSDDAGGGAFGDDAATADGGSRRDGSVDADGSDGSTAPDGSSDDGGATDVDGGDDAGGEEEDAGVDAGPPPGPLTPAYADFAINHVLVTGQSNSVANGADPPLTTTAPAGYGNLRFNTGVMSMKSCNGDGCTTYDTPSSFVPLVEGDSFFGYAVETPSSGIAYEISNLAKQRYEFGTNPEYPTKHDVLVSVHGRSGNTYWCLRKGFCNYNQERGHLSPFAQAMSEVQSAKALAASAGKSYVVRAAVAIHGESDHYSYVAGTPEFPLPGTDGTPGKIKDYADALVEWQQDYESSVKAITSQTQPVPLLVSGLSGWTTTRESKLVQMQLDAHIRAPGKVVYVTPAYPLEVRNDCLHYSAKGSRRLGEYFGKVYAKIVFGGETWEPVRPKTVTRAGNVITVKFHVPKPPLVLDTTNVSKADNFGFDVYDNGNLVAVSGVTVAGDTATITLASAPSGVNMRLKYAQNYKAGGCIGPGIEYAGGARGNLRDSDDTPSQFGNPLWNWGVNFDVAVP